MDVELSKPCCVCDGDHWGARWMVQFASGKRPVVSCQADDPEAFANWFLSSVSEGVDE